jgi:hypothetical protein
MHAGDLLGFRATKATHPQNSEARRWKQSLYMLPRGTKREKGTASAGPSPFTCARGWWSSRTALLEQPHTNQALTSRMARHGRLPAAQRRRESQKLRLWRTSRTALRGMALSVAEKTQTAALKRRKVLTAVQGAGLQASTRAKPPPTALNQNRRPTLPGGNPYGTPRGMLNPPFPAAMIQKGRPTPPRRLLRATPLAVVRPLSPAALQCSSHLTLRRLAYDPPCGWRKSHAGLPGMEKLALATYGAMPPPGGGELRRRRWGGGWGRGMDGRRYCPGIRR